MSSWIPSQIRLQGKVIDLLPLEEAYFHELEVLAADKRIWEHYIYDGSDPGRIKAVLQNGLKEREKGTQFPFVIFHKKDARVIGSTRFLDMQPSHKKLEIGTTWLHPDYWGSMANPEAKLLLLTFCFEVLKTFRVQFKTDENNLRSRKAIEKIGGVFEGVLRNDMVRDDNSHRNSAVYSILSQEWEEKKRGLVDRLKSKDSTKAKH